MTDPTTVKATGIGALAIAMWSTLALFTVLSTEIPPFQLLAISFTVASATGFIWAATSKGGIGAAVRQFRQPVFAWALGIGGLFGYHFFYFVALRYAPALEANLLNYLWPLLIVVFSAALPGERLRWFHGLGALCGLAGTIVVILGPAAFTASAGDRGPLFALGEGAWFGYLMALAAALTWSSYSVLSRRISGKVPTAAVTGFCLATALLSGLAHLFLEETVAPSGLGWVAAICLGLGPVGGAFFVWDHGVKKGDIRILGVLSYTAPLLSTVTLIAIGAGEPSAAIALGCILIVGGAMLASQEMWRGLLRRQRA